MNESGNPYKNVFDNGALANSEVKSFPPPNVPPFKPENIPEELKGRRQWICWRYELRDGKPVKMPLQPRGNKPIHADVTDPNCLGKFEEAVENALRKGLGIGFAFFSGDGLTGVDVDKLDCVDEEVKRQVEAVNSYVERSVSGRGLHVIGYGKLTEPIKREGLEAYSRDRFFVVTGDHVPGTPKTLGDIQPFLDMLQAKYARKTEKHTDRAETAKLNNWEDTPNAKGYTLREIRMRDDVLDEYLRGGLAGKPSPSEADMGSLERLMFWGYTPDEAVEILRRYRWRDKLAREDYIKGMLRKLLPLKETVKLKMGFARKQLCPHCGSGSLEPSHTDDLGTMWFKCQNCSNYCTWEELEKAFAEVEKPLSVPHLNMVEDPGLAGKPLIVEAVVSSTSVPYLVPKRVEASLERKDEDPTLLEQNFEPDNPINIKFVGVNEDVKYRRLKRLFGEPSKVSIREKDWRTIYLVRVRPPVFTLEKRGESIVNEKGFEYKAFDVYAAAEKPLTFHPSALVRLEVKPLGSPKTQKTVLLAYRVEFPEETLNFNESKLRQLKARLDSLGSVKGKLEWILNEFEKFSGLVGRLNLALAGFLTFFSPVWIILDGEPQRGWVVTLFIGDTTTGKSETIRKLITLLKGGMLVTAETASQVGLTGTATQLEKEGWFVDWGFLVLSDRKLLAIDGVHKLPFSCWAALSEAERSGVVTIAKAAKNSAYARTRQVKIANPVDRDAERWTTKPLADFLYPCQSLPTVLDRTGIARLDLAVFADSRDVGAKEVNVRMNEPPDSDLELLGEALKWCWSGTAKVEFTDEAFQKILTSATDLYNNFHTQSIPLVSMDAKWKLARLSAALANLTLSTDDFTKVKVTAEHVAEVVEFLKDEYGKAGLNTLAQEERYEVYTSEDVEAVISNTAEQTSIEKETLEDILKFIVLQGRFTRDQLKAKFKLAENSQLRPLLASLKNEDLIRIGRGFYSTPKLIQLYKVLESSRLSTLTRVEKEPLKNSGEKSSSGEKCTPSFSRVVNLDNLDKKGKAFQGSRKPPANIASIVQLDEPDHGTCCICDTQASLTHQIEDSEGLWGLVCQDCADKVRGENPEVESEGEEEGGLDYGSCEVCGKPGAPAKIRAGQIVYLHSECEGEWEGPL